MIDHKDLIFSSIVKMQVENQVIVNLFHKKVSSLKDEDIIKTRRLKKKLLCSDDFIVVQPQRNHNAQRMEILNMFALIERTSHILCQQFTKL